MSGDSVRLGAAVEVRFRGTVTALLSPYSPDDPWVDVVVNGDGHEAYFIEVRAADCTIVPE